MAIKSRHTKGEESAVQLHVQDKWLKVKEVDV